MSLAPCQRILVKEPTTMSATASTDDDKVVRSYPTLLLLATNEALELLSEQTGPLAPNDIEQALLGHCNLKIAQHNQIVPKELKYKPVTALAPWQVAKILIAFHHGCTIATSLSSADRESQLIALYREDGPMAGTYSTVESDFIATALTYNIALTHTQIKDLFNSFRALAPSVQREMDRDLIVLANGIFDYRTKTLSPFTPEKIFLTKSPIDFNPDATDEVIIDPDGDPFTVEGWMSSLAPDDPQLVHTLWQLIGASIRPMVPWGKAAFLYSNFGNNGKGTFCSLVRSIVGVESVASIPLAQFAHEFALEPLARASAVVVDENDVNQYIDRVAHLKEAITADVISINRKHKSHVSIRFHGLIIQCLNDMPKVRDRTDSFYRRQLMLHFSQKFEGKEKRFIKHDLLKRQSVLEYVLYRVLMMEDYYELSVPDSSLALLHEYKNYNDPVRDFFFSIQKELVWDLVPYPFLYNLYGAWYSKSFSSSAGMVGRNTFISEIKAIVESVSNNENVLFEASTKRIRPGSYMDAPEPLIATYRLHDWADSTYAGTSANPAYFTVPDAKKATHYEGLVRKGSKLSTSPAPSADHLDPAMFTA